jgi:hypothetical protein
VDAEQSRERQLQQGCWHSLARHVAEDQEHGAFVGGHEVVEVAADLLSRFHPRGPEVARCGQRYLGEQVSLDSGSQPELFILDCAGSNRIQQFCAGDPEVEPEVCQGRDRDRCNHVADPLKLVPRRPDGVDDHRFGLRTYNQDERARCDRYSGDLLSRHDA